MNSKPDNEKRHAGEAWRGSKAKQTNCKTKTTNTSTTGARYHKKALEFMQLVSA